jgi:hypothetical protein
MCLTLAPGLAGAGLFFLHQINKGRALPDSATRPNGSQPWLGFLPAQAWGRGRQNWRAGVSS